MTQISSHQMTISANAFRDESEVLRELANSLTVYEKLVPRIQDGATRIVEKLRKEGTGHGVEAFLQEYGLNTKEGIAIMSLAEALLRIPDEHTADDLIRDKFEGRQWDQHLGKSESLLVNASSWGLLLTGKMLEFTTPTGQNASNVLKKLINRLGEPTVRESLKTAVKYIGTQFVMGTDIREAMARAKPAQKRGYSLSYDVLGEGARTQKQADQYFADYMDAIEAIDASKNPRPPSLSIKLSALHPRYQLVKKERLFKELLPKLKKLVSRARDAGIIVSIDAEESYRLDIHMLLFEALLMDDEFRGLNGIGFVLQAYGKRAYEVIGWLAELAERSGNRIPVRLVKGAYWDTEIKLGQVNGLESYPVFTRKSNTDLSYIACAEAMLRNKPAFYPQFATHNAYTLVAVREMAADLGWKPDDYEFQRLHGMGEKLYDQLIGDIPCRIYAPVGKHKDLLAYLIRRLLENGANSSFVNQLMDETFPLEVLLADPLDKIRNRQFTAHPDIPQPRDLYGDRINPQGYDFGNAAHLVSLKGQTQRHYAEKIDVTKWQDAGYSIEKAKQAQIAWNMKPVREIAVIMEQAAELLMAHQAELLSLCVFEAKKTLPDAVAELREAVDFCRYYANQARILMVPKILPGPTGESNELHVHGRGVYVCISPWNFPLAIFMGQLVAALVTGNAVIAKPAEQTPKIAIRTVELLHKAGVPEAILQLAIGGGDVGAALVSSEDIAGVCFTGSVPTAKAINRALANRDGAILPLIAETGGQNCMIVDSTALLEQAVDDVVLSAFGSAGQRCSALRVLMVQEEVADELLEMIELAMDELRVDDPSNPATDLGAVIDSTAQKRLLDHISAMEANGKVIKKLNINSVEGSGTYIPPTLIALDSLNELKEEFFGPVLHVVRFKSKEMEELPKRINDSGFGLTFGLHSRIEDHWDLVQQQVHCGNIYINRNMTGAVVGVQPFGGEGLSGTGPKAGGPHYLSRFITERTITINTAAIGGNLELLS